MTIWGLVLALLLALVEVASAQIQPQLPRTRLQGLGTQVVDVTHDSALLVHVANASHITVSVGSISATSEAVNVFHQSTVTHVSSVTHVVGTMMLSNQAGALVTVTGTALDVNCTGCSASANVNVDHVSSATHIVGRVFLSNALGTAVTVTGTALDVNCTGCAAASVVNVGHISAVQHVAGYGTFVVRQHGQSTLAHISSVTHVIGSAYITTQAGSPIVWTEAVSHVSSVTHVYGTVSLVSKSGTYVTVTGTALDVNCTGCSAAASVNVGHVSSVLHVAIVDWQRSAHVASAQSGVWNVTAHQGGNWTVAATQSGTWNIAHLGGAVHVAGTINGAAFHVQGLGLPGQAHGGVLSVQGVAGGVALSVSCANCSGGSGDAVNVFHQSTIRHISSVTHVAGYGTFLVNFHGSASSSVAQSGVWNVTAHQGGEWNVRHVSMLQHVVIVDWQRWAHVASAQSGIWNVTAHQGGSWTVAATQSGEWNVRHIGSVVHVAGYGTFLVNLHGSATVSVSQSGTWNVVAHQGGTWNIAHLGGAVHVAGTINGAAFHVQGLGLPGQAHGGVLSVQGVAGGVSLAVTCSNCSGGSGDAVNVFHQSTIRHISSVTHVAGYGTFLVNFHGSASSSVAQSGVWNVVAHQGGGGWNIAHISSRVHVTGHFFLTNYTGAPLRTYHGNSLGMTMQNSSGSEVIWTEATSHVSSQQHLAIALKPGSNHVLVEVVGQHQSGAIHVAGISNIGSGNAGTGTTGMICHSTLAIHIGGTSSMAYTLVHLTSSNGGLNQANWRIFICSVVLYTNSNIANNTAIVLPAATPNRTHYQATFSLVEGSGTDCATNTRGVVGWAQTTPGTTTARGGSIPLFNHATSINWISPFPWISTQVTGNSLCIQHNILNSASYLTGAITYRASQ